MVKVKWFSGQSAFLKIQVQIPNTYVKLGEECNLSDPIQVNEKQPGAPIEEYVERKKQQ